MVRAVDRPRNKTKKKPHKTKPGEFEVRIGPDGRVAALVADEALMDVLDKLNSDSPLAVQRRKAKTRGRSRKT